jgi:hypothetical protein
MITVVELVEAEAVRVIEPVPVVGYEVVPPEPGVAMPATVPPSVAPANVVTGWETVMLGMTPVTPKPDNVSDAVPVIGYEVVPPLAGVPIPAVVPANVEPANVRAG